MNTSQLGAVMVLIVVLAVGVALADQDGPFPAVEYPGGASRIIHVLQPVGGEVWTAGATQLVAWNVDEAIGYVSARLYDGATERAVLGYVPAGELQMTVEVPFYAGDGDNYTVHLRWSDETGVVGAASSPVFGIAGSWAVPSLTLTSPNGGEVWAADSFQTVTWTSQNPTGDVEIWVFDGGTRYDYLGTAAMADGQFTWPIVPCIGDRADYRILVRWANDEISVEDASDADFEIAGSFDPTITITSPTSSDVWPAGTTQLITWVSDCATCNVDVKLDSVRVLGRVPVMDGGLTWYVPTGLGTSYNPAITVTLNECGDTDVQDEFHVSGLVAPTLTLVSPQSGETITAGQPYTITWQSTDIEGDVDILVPNDSWYQTGRISVPASAGSFVWPVPLNLAAGSYPGVTLIASDSCAKVTASSGTINIVAGTGTFGDVNGDGDVDVRDLVEMQRSYTARGFVILDPAIAAFDAEPDGDIDIDDACLLLDALCGPVAE
ncbi:MAG: hypothetical protein JXO22_12420 [Phycisphaerae bacterium]|nr:hypothetical protein [Phycisphaerae bacterium]